MTIAPTRPNEQTIIRWSSTWWIYMLARGGILRAIVNGTEDALAITGRNLLLVFLIYCGAKAGAFLVAPKFSFPVWLEMSMFVLQLGGLEGSIPGLARQAKALREQPDPDEEAAERINKVMLSARILTVLSMAEGALHSLQMMDDAMKYISAVLLVVRGIVITGFLIELAKIQSEGPRVLSRSEHERELERDRLEGEQAQTIVDLQAQLEREQEETSQLRTQLAGIPEVLQTLENERERGATLQGQLGSEQRTVSTLRIQLDAEQKRVEALQEELSSGQGDMSVLQRQLHSTNLQVIDLTAKLREKEQECKSVKGQVAELIVKVRESESVKEVVKEGVKVHNKTVKGVIKEESFHSETGTLSQGNITSIDQARRSVKASDAEVLSYIKEHPGLKVPEVANHFEVTPRTIYNILKRQETSEKSESEVVGQP